MSESTFENNHATSVFTDLPSRVSGGGLSITITYHNSNGISNNFVMQGTYNYTIQNCTFFNNNASSIAPTTRSHSILEGGHINNRGGGVSFYVVHPSVVEFKVLHCNFINNSASAFGGGLYVFSPELLTEEDFTIAYNHLEGNEARISAGGIAIGIIFQHTKWIQYLNKSVLTESVIVCRNTFVRNRAILGHGGAMFIGPGEWAVVAKHIASIP